MKNCVGNYMTQINSILPKDKFDEFEADVEKLYEFEITLKKRRQVLKWGQQKLQSLRALEQNKKIETKPFMANFEIDVKNLELFLFNEDKSLKIFEKNKQTDQNNENNEDKG